MIKAASLATEFNLLRFSQFLQSQGIRHRINEESGQQVIWVEGEGEAAFVRTSLSSWSFEKADPTNSGANFGIQAQATLARALRNFLNAFLRAPVSMALVIACLIVAVISSLGSQPQRVASLFYPLLDTAGLLPLLLSINSLGELLRSFTPMLLHFGELHLVFNMLWLWYFGRQLEATHPRWLFLALILLCSFIANTTQYLFSGYNNFGGMSGVVYGLVAYTWLIHTFMPRSHLLISNSMFIVFVIALIAMEVLASSWIASAAHVGGLISGLVFAVIVVIFYRLILKRSAIEKR